MKRSIHHVISHAAAVTLLAASFTTLLQAQRFLPTTTADAAEQAGAIVRARVLDTHVRDEGWIWTYFDFEALETFKGVVTPKFTAKMMGGQIGDKATQSGVPLPALARGQEVILFIAPERMDDGSVILMRDHLYYVSTTAGMKLVQPTPTGFPATALDARGGAPNPSRLDAFINALRTVK